MANYQNGSDLVSSVLNVCGELTDGTSSFQADALVYLNLAYKGVLTGGNIYGIDVADPWPWALSKRPISITLQPAIQNITVTVTQLSYTVTFSAPPQDPYGNNISVKGWWLNAIQGREEWFQITSHAVGSTTAQIDVPYTEASVANTTCKLILLDYDLVDNSVVIESSNCYIDFTENDGSAHTATLAQGIYTPDSFVTLVAAALNAASAGAQVYSASWNAVTRLFTWSSNKSFQLNNASGTYASVSASEVMGLDCTDLTGASSYTSVYPLNAINRLTSPMLCYRKPNTPWRNPKNEGKIYELSFNTFVREYPLTMLVAGTPDKFTVVKRAPNGIVTVRFNGYFYVPSKVEVGYIPVYRALQNNTASIPVLPEEHRKYLVDAAAGMLMHDKVDSRRLEREGLAKAGLQALQHSSRKELSLVGISYGKLVPRYGMTQKRWWWQIT